MTAQSLGQGKPMAAWVVLRINDDTRRVRTYAALPDFRFLDGNTCCGCSGGSGIDRDFVDTLEIYGHANCFGNGAGYFRWGSCPCRRYFNRQRINNVPRKKQYMVIYLVALLVLTIIILFVLNFEYYRHKLGVSTSHSSDSMRQSHSG